MPGSQHGPSIKNPATYEALKREGKSKSTAAAISNWALNVGYAKGVHRRKRKDASIMITQSDALHPEAQKLSPNKKNRKSPDSPPRIRPI